MSVVITSIQAEFPEFMPLRAFAVMDLGNVVSRSASNQMLDKCSAVFRFCMAVPSPIDHRQLCACFHGSVRLFMCFFDTVDSSPEDSLKGECGHVSSRLDAKQLELEYHEMEKAFATLNPPPSPNQLQPTERLLHDVLLRIERLCRFRCKLLLSVVGQQIVPTAMRIHAQSCESQSCTLGTTR